MLGTRVSLVNWHNRFGHLAFPIVQKILAQFNLPVSSRDNAICDACQYAKNHRLPFQLSSSISTDPLELIHSDVWGKAPVDSCDNFQYYVIFIDDYSK